MSGDNQAHADKLKKAILPWLLLMGVLFFCLTIAGTVEARQVQINFYVLQDLFITLLFFTILTGVIFGAYMLFKHSSYISKYEISKERGSKKERRKRSSSKEGLENQGFHEDLEKGNKARDMDQPDGDDRVKEEAWVKNYVAYENEDGSTPNGDAAQDNRRVEEDKMEEDMEEKKKQDNKAEAEGEEKRKEEEKGEKEEKWKENYVEYDEDKEDKSNE